MYSKGKMLINTSNDVLSTFIENGDLYNSKFIKVFRMLPSVGEYDINSREQRLDILSRELYDSESYGDFILVYNGMTINDLRANRSIKVFQLSDLLSLMSDISSIKSPRDYIKSITR